MSERIAVTRGGLRGRAAEIGLPGIILGISMLLAGVALWRWVDHGDFEPPRTVWMVILCVAVGVSTPALRRATADAQLTDPAGTPPSAAISLLVGAVAALYFAASAGWQGRDMGPHAHDEFMYLTQASQLATGRLWSAIDPAIADFFDSTYLIVRPVYAALSWPGTALVYAPGAKLGLPPWWTAATLAGMTVGAFFHIARELFASLLTAVVFATFIAVGRPFHVNSVTVNSHMPELLAGGIAMISALRWTRTSRPVWAAAFGAAGGWAAVCRPVDAICLLLPVVLVVVVSAWKQRRNSARRQIMTALALLALSAIPFFALQLVFDHGVTGRWLDTPFAYYCRRDYPQIVYGFPRYDPHAQPLSVITQKHDLYNQFAVSFVLAHQPGNWMHDWATGRVPAAFRGGQPAPLLLIAVPLGAAVLVCGRRRWALAVVASLPLFCVLYAPYTFFLPTYAVLCGPAICLCAVAGVTRLAGFFRSPVTRAAVISASVGIALATLPEVNSASDYSSHPAGVMAARALDRLIPSPLRAVVLVRYHTGNPIHDEPVYNWTVASPDDARIVLAHDLGARNIELFRHYARLQRDRQIYLLDRADYRLQYLGTAADLGRTP